MGHNGERSRGASRLRDWPDAEWRLIREGAEVPGAEPPPDAARFFTAEGRDVALSETKLAYHLGSRRLSIAGGNRIQHAATKHEPLVLEIIGAQPGINVRVLDQTMQAKGASRDQGRAALRAAIGAGKVHTAPRARNAVLHFLDDGCGQPANCALGRVEDA